ncbi:unnamed protein product [Fraxinus pennsylvanica]|uniref:Uncharacterized protein n=1 Tax=Fraxinus pennsylvanica TaxID=56036 RepID=A0AAD2A9C2_9LAMI|nr:unnamed protein product [Fraxinus pennsylvanica]
MKAGETAGSNHSSVDTHSAYLTSHNILEDPACTSEISANHQLDTTEFPTPIQTTQDVHHSASQSLLAPVGSADNIQNAERDSISYEEVEELRDVVSSPLLVRAPLRRALAFEAIGKYEMAMQDMLALLNTDPNHRDALEIAGRLRMALGPQQVAQLDLYLRSLHLQRWGRLSVLIIS